MERIKLEDSLITASCAYYRREFQRQKFRIYERLQQKEHASALSLESATAYAALEQTFGIARAVKQTLLKHCAGQEEFLQVYALYCGASIGIQQLTTVVQHGVAQHVALDLQKG